MTLIRRQATLGAVALCFLPTANQCFSQTAYFPPHSFWSDARKDHFERKWYGEALARMSEPSLFPSGFGSSLEVYRLLWLRSFDDTIALRLEVLPDGSGTLTIKVVGRRGDVLAGELYVDEKKHIEQPEVLHFLQIVRAGGFWKDSKPRRQNGTDGAEWILEGFESGNYHLVDRWSPTSGDVHDAGIALITMSGLAISKDRIY